MSGRGRVQLRIDGRRALAADAESLRAAALLPISRGAHVLELDYERVGPGPRLRLGWSMPSAGLLPARDETIPPRRLGAPLAGLWWPSPSIWLSLRRAVRPASLRLTWDCHGAAVSAGDVEQGLALAACGLLGVLAAMSGRWCAFAGQGSSIAGGA